MQLLRNMPIRWVLHIYIYYNRKINKLSKSMQNLVFSYYFFNFSIY